MAVAVADRDRELDADTKELSVGFDRHLNLDTVGGTGNVLGHMLGLDLLDCWLVRDLDLGIVHVVFGGTQCGLHDCSYSVVICGSHIFVNEVLRHGIEVNTRVGGREVDDPTIVIWFRVSATSSMCEEVF